MEAKKVKTLMNIQRAKEFYVIMSKCTGLPYVSCNEETMDDEVFVYLNEEAAKSYADEIVAEGGIAKAYSCNVLNKEICYNVADEVLKDFGPCDILVNGAGGNNP